MTVKATGKTYRLVLRTPATVGASCHSSSKDSVSVSSSSSSNNKDGGLVLPLRGVIFDMDGTLTRPQTWMFGEMRRQLQVPAGVDILDHVASLATVEAQTEAEAKLQAIEEKAMREQEPTKGLQRAFAMLSERGVYTSICTRNVAKPVGDFCGKFLQCDPFDGDGRRRIVTGPVVTREFKPPKPAPEPLLHIISAWGVAPQQVLMVGDSRDDMDAGLAAGCAVVLLRHEDNSHVETAYLEKNASSKLDAVVSDLDHLSMLLQAGLTVTPNKGGPVGDVGPAGPAGPADN